MKGLTAATRSPCHDQVLSELLQAQLMLKATQGTGIDIDSHYRRNRGRPWKVESGGSCWGFFEPTSSDIRLLFLGPQSVTHAPVDLPPILFSVFHRCYHIKQPATKSQV